MTDNKKWRRVPSLVLVGCSVFLMAASTPKTEAPAAFSRPLVEDPVQATALADCAFAEQSLAVDLNIQVLQMFDDCIPSLKAGPQKAHYLHIRGSIFSLIRLDERARTDLTEAVRLRPEALATLLELGPVLIRLEDIEAAKEIYKTALRLSPGDADAMAGMGRSHLKLGGLMPAEAFLQKALDVDPGNISALMDRGLIALHRKAPVRAAEYYSRVIEIDQSHGEAFLQRGVSQVQAGLGKEALEDFDKAAELIPESDRVLANRGALLAGLGKDALAIEDFTQALMINPFNANALYGRGLVRARHASRRDRTSIDAARSDLRQAMTLDPSNQQLDGAIEALDKLAD